MEILNNNFNLLPNDILNEINEQYSNNNNNNLSILLSSLLSSCRDIGTRMRNGDFSHEEVGTTNSSGDEQLHVDLSTEQIIFNNLRSSGVCILASSEETTEEVECGANEGFSVSFDPLDGSSIVDANFAVGTICGVWPNRGLLNRTGREQVASLIAQYGPRVTVMLALNSNATKSGQPICMELTMLPTHWIITKHIVTIKSKCKTFAPGNLRATSDNPQYKSLIDYWIESKYTLRYSGGLVPDVYHILTKGEGIFTNASSKSAKAKLRLLYECAAIGLIIEAANGSTCVAPCEKGDEQIPISILDVPVTYLDKRVGLCVGSKEEVERFKSYIFNEL